MVLHSIEIVLSACKVLSRQWADCEVLQFFLCLTGVDQSCNPSRGLHHVRRSLNPAQCKSPEATAQGRAPHWCHKPRT